MARSSIERSDTRQRKDKCELARNLDCNCLVEVATQLA
jgi:hypothetical protein